MRENLLELNERGLSDIPVILGGAALTRTYVETRPALRVPGPAVLRQGCLRGPPRDGPAHGASSGGVSSDPDFGGLSRAAKEPDPASGERPRPQQSASAESGRPGTRPLAGGGHRQPPVRPPFVGARVERGMSLDEIAAFVNETALFRGQWGYRPDKSSAGGRHRVQAADPCGVSANSLRGSGSGVLQPAVAYGWFAVNSDGDDLVVWKDDDRSSEWLRFAFPRQSSDPWLCISDFFRPVELRRTRLRGLPHRRPWARRPPRRRRDCSRRTATRTTCTSTAWRSR